MDKKINITEEELLKISGGENINVSSYSEEELARIFDLHFEMYGFTNALPHLKQWGVCSGDLYIVGNRSYWGYELLDRYPTDGAKLAHIVYKRIHS